MRSSISVVAAVVLVLSAATAPPAQARWTTAEADVDGVKVTVEIWSNRRIPAELAAAAIEEYARVRRLIDETDLGSEPALDLNGERGAGRSASPQLQLDVRAVATGQALAFAAARLRSAGVENARLIARGVAYYIGDRRGRPWFHGISSARQLAELDAANFSQKLAQLSLSDAAVASVGSFSLLLENEPVFFEDEPAVVAGVPSRQERLPLRSATVFGPNPAHAEGLAQMILELGAVAGFERLLTFPGYDAIVFNSAGEVAHTAGLTVVYGGPSIPPRFRR